MHYLAFLIGRGWAPYREIADQQFPGAYLIEMAGMHLFGMGSLAWRVYDFSLLGLATAAFFVVTRNPGARPATTSDVRDGTATSWFPGLFAACLFILFHGRDGLMQGGQRDLAMAVLLLMATAFLFIAIRRRWVWASAVFGLLSGVAFSIKPTVLPLSIAQLGFACYVCRRMRIPWRAYSAWAALAALAGPAAGVVFLLREHAFAAFLTGFRGIVPYYASLGHRPLTYILLHSVSPMLFLVIVWFVLVAIRAFEQDGTAALPDGLPVWIRDWERTTLLAGAAFAVLDCILQARALPYYRYPLLAFLLPLMAIDFYRAARQPWSGMRRRAGAGLAFTAVFFAAFILAPQSAVLIHRYRWWETDFITALEHDLNALGGPALSGHIECVDSISGCTTVLYRMRLEPALDFPGDYLLFGPESVPIVRQTHEQLASRLATDAPAVIVVSSASFLSADSPEQTTHFEKLALWPELAGILAHRYTLAAEWHPYRLNRWWSRAELPAGYRIYVVRMSARAGR
jgi:hypothetical protein